MTMMASHDGTAAIIRKPKSRAAMAAGARVKATRGTHSGRRGTVERATARSLFIEFDGLQGASGARLHRKSRHTVQLLAPARVGDLPPTIFAALPADVLQHVLLHLDPVGQTRVSAPHDPAWPMRDVRCAIGGWMCVCVIAAVAAAGWGHLPSLAHGPRCWRDAERPGSAAELTVFLPAAGSGRPPRPGHGTG